MSERYLYSENERHRVNEVEKLFDDFDDDRSGFLDFEEVTELFESNNIPVEEDELREIFRVIQDSTVVSRDLRGLRGATTHKQKALRLYLEDLKRFVLSRPGKEKFRKIMRKVRSKQDEFAENTYIPVSFEAMLK